MKLDSILIVAGEVSGDIQGAKLVVELKELSPGIKITGIGGDNMKSAGVELLHHVREMSFLGFSEIIKHLPFIRRVLNELTHWIEMNRPSAVVLIDYPGFNLKLAQRAKKLGCKVIYYISPQIWAWGKSRIKKIARFVDLMIVVFPFEEKLYKDYGINVEFVGHPMLEGLDNTSTKAEFFEKHKLDERKTLIGLLPGSRLQEVERLYPTMLEAVEKMRSNSTELQSVTSLSPALDKEIYSSIEQGKYAVHSTDTHDVMQHSDLLIVASGSATLESAFFGTPLIIVYRLSPISWFLGNLLVNIKSIGLVNIVAGENIAPEILQSDLTADRLAEEALSIITNDKISRMMSDKLSGVKKLLGEPGASMKAAKSILRNIAS
ncbi:MAG: lipid-A-disaccharide synthase [Candidatus Marinimicrobia bacterium]|nr:lipid-A-disaccharide synthase [Candidatus Neomarinimicrobiota bacterium]